MCSDELEAAGKLIPIGVTDSAIGGQRIEEYMVNDTTLTACSDRSGEASPEWNGRLFGSQTLPYVDMTIKGFLWYQVCMPPICIAPSLVVAEDTAGVMVGWGCVDGWGDDTTLTHVALVGGKQHGRHKGQCRCKRRVQL